ncbi:MAG: hypothetical protein CML68_20425 [Rhodobacteraceae bacterium]|nr:hypothetical protein [Paracoccaceae bacterium]
MNTATLTELVESTTWSDQSVQDFLNLVNTSADEEDGIVVLVAAATLLARKCQGNDANQAHAAATLGGEFIQLMFAVLGEMSVATACRRIELMGVADV